MQLGRVAIIICETRLLDMLPRVEWAISIEENMTDLNQYSEYFKKEDDCSYTYIPEKPRIAVYERDNYMCLSCGTSYNLSIDHVTPKSQGGKTTLKNCQTLCMSCNRKKGAR